MGKTLPPRQFTTLPGASFGVEASALWVVHGWIAGRIAARTFGDASRACMRGSASDEVLKLPVWMEAHLRKVKWNEAWKHVSSGGVAAAAVVVRLLCVVDRTCVLLTVLPS